MNELIYELAKDAGYNIKTYWTSDDNYKTLAQTEHYRKDDELEKFAELVIKECAKVCWDKYRNDDSLSRNVGVMFSNDIKKHFGVEDIV